MFKIHKVLLLIALLGIAISKNVKINAETTVGAVSPKALKEEWESHNFKASAAAFGFNPYGQTIVGSAHLASNLYGCGPIEHPHYDEEYDFTPIVVIKRGNCSFTTKAKNAQFIGAKLVMIIDDNAMEDVTSIIMADDGKGESINVPVVLISEIDGETIMKYLNNTNETVSRSVALSVKFSMPHYTNHVEYELWMSSENNRSYDIVEELYPLEKSFGNETTMSVHYYLWFCPECQANNFNTSAPEDCLSSGRYCAPDPDGAGKGTGEQVLYEDLRQMCVLEIYGRDRWWGYMKGFHQKCVHDPNSWENNCHEEVLTGMKLNMNVDAVKKCINDSFNGTDHKVVNNFKLMAENKESKSKGVYSYPELIINGQAFRGNLDTDNIQEAICAGFKDEPDNCYKLIETGDGKIVINYKHKNFIFLAGGFVLVIILIVVALVVWRKVSNSNREQRMNQQINDAVSQYFSMNSEQNEGKEIKAMEEQRVVDDQKFENQEIELKDMESQESEQI